MKNINHRFSILEYKRLLRYFLELNLNFKRFADNLTNGQNIVMRHDIDFCPERALEIAKIEYSFKIPSTYFFLVNSDFYNLNTLKNKKILQQIMEMGHDIGLHFDASLSKKWSDINNNCKKEIKYLESLTFKRINIISFHRPAKRLLLEDKKIANKDHTYLLKFTKKINYCSDSQGNWKYVTPKKIIEKESTNNFTLQLLTHPIWWTTPGKYSPEQKINYHLKKKYQFYKKLAGNNCKPYSLYLKNKKEVSKQIFT